MFHYITLLTLPVWLGRKWGRTRCRPGCRRWWRGLSCTTLSGGSWCWRREGRGWRRWCRRHPGWWRHGRGCDSVGREHQPGPAMVRNRREWQYSNDIQAVVLGASSRWTSSEERWGGGWPGETTDRRRSSRSRPLGFNCRAEKFFFFYIRKISIFCGALKIF